MPTEVLLLVGILLLFVFGPRRQGRKQGPVQKAVGGVVVVWLVLAGAIVLAWRALAGDGPCPMGMCSGSAESSPATAATTLDGRWMGQAGDAHYVLNLTQSGTGVSGTGTRKGESLTVDGSASPNGVQLDLGGASFTGAFSDSRTVRGHLQTPDGDHELVLRKRSR